MSDGIIEIEIKAPEFDRQLKRLGNSMNGTQLTLDEDIRLFKGVEDILLKLPLCKDGDMRAFRFPLPRGTFEEFIMDEYDGEDVDDEELKEARCFFDYEYPDEHKWYILAYTANRGGGRYLCVNGKCVFIDPSRSDGKQYWEHDVLLSHLNVICGKMVVPILDGTYVDIVNETIPYRYRRGVVRRKDLWETGYFPRENDLDGLTDGEIERFAELIDNGCSERPVDRIPEMTVNRYLELCSVCFTARGCNLDGMDLKERYMRYADGRDSGMLDLDPDDPSAFAEFLKVSHDGHVWEVRPGHGYSRMHLYPHHDDRGYYLSIGGNFDRAVFIRTALGIHDMGLPLEIYQGEKVLRAVRGEDWLGIVPEKERPFYQSYLYEEHDVIDCISYSDELMDMVGNRVTWYPVMTFYD